MRSPASLSPDDLRRQRWLSVLARGAPDCVEGLWQAIAEVPAHTILRPPEIGLVMVRGRISGSGAPFALGEMTVTRAAVRLATGEVGLGYAAGRARRQAEIAALVDALGQIESWRPVLEAQVIGPLEEVAAARQRRRTAEAAATRVEFFTVAREAGA